VNDEELADAWLAGALARSITHEEHVRIAFVLVRRFGRDDAVGLVDEGTRLNSAALGVPERYDGELTRRWTTAIADALEDDPDADAFLRRRPEFLRGDLFGLPAWKRD
jgi:hypothetical protein